MCANSRCVYQFPLCVLIPFVCGNALCLFVLILLSPTHSNPQDCHSHHLHNSHECDLRTHYSFFHHVSCHYCCSDMQCMRDHLAPSVVTSKPTLTTSAAPVTQAPTTSPPHSQSPLVHHSDPLTSCYTPCSHGDELATCAAGQFVCGPDQVSWACFRREPPAGRPGDFSPRSPPLSGISGLSV